jgi:hypothetical protein
MTTFAFRLDARKSALISPEIGGLYPAQPLAPVLLILKDIPALA